MNQLAFAVSLFVQIYAPLIYFVLLTWWLGHIWRERGLLRKSPITRKRVMRIAAATLILALLGVGYLYILMVSYFYLQAAFRIGDCMDGPAICDWVSAQGRILVPATTGVALAAFGLTSLRWVWIWWRKADISAEKSQAV